jgi:hypothetical protein
MISGTTSDLWEKHADTFDAMSGFELIDMKQFAEDRTTNSTFSTEAAPSVEK